MGIKPTIVVVAYRRLDTLSRLLESVNNGYYSSNDVRLIISIDYHKENQDVINYSEGYNWLHGEKIVVKHDANLGLRKHIIECGDYALKYDSIIILEDDEVVAPNFYEYARLAQDYYADEERVAGVSLYSHEWNIYAGKKFQPIKKTGDVFFGQFSCTWGQSWTSSQWSLFKEWYANNDEIIVDEKLPSPIYAWKESWGKYFIRYLVETDRYYVLPYHAYSTVYGVPGVHSKHVELDVQVSLNQGMDSPRFTRFDDGSHYDSFFENKDLVEVISKRYNISPDEICIDIYGSNRKEYFNRRYILTTKKLNYKVIDSFELNSRPQEMSVITNSQGNSVMLYDRSVACKNTIYRRKNRVLFDLAGVKAGDAVFYLISHIGDIIKRQL